VAILHVPAELNVGRPAHFSLTADDCTAVTARLQSPEMESRVWTWPCPVQRGLFEWAPSAPGQYTLLVSATSAQGLTASQSVVLRARAAREGASP
jgi:hypothetical protein